MHDEHYCYHTGVEGRRGEQGPAGGNGYSPTVEIVRVRRGHEVRVTDLDGEHVFTVRDGFDGSGLIAKDGDGNCWYGPRFENDGDTGLLVEDDEGNVWYCPVGEGAAGDAIIGDEDECAWYMLECGEGPKGDKGDRGDDAAVNALATAANNGKILGVVNGQLAAVSLTAWTGGSY